MNLKVQSSIRSQNSVAVGLERHFGFSRFRFLFKVANQFTIPPRSQYDAEWFEVGARWSSFEIPGKLSIVIFNSNEKFEAYF